MNKLVSGIRSGRLVKVFMCFAALAFLCVFYGLAVYNTPKTDAAVQATDFVAGRIIDDEIFYDANTMSVEEIQAFLDAKLPTCDMWGTGSSAGRVVSETGYVMPAGSTNADYARLRAAAGNSRYHEPPYICVNKYYENPETHETLYETNGIVKDGMISAAQIIYNEAQRYSINPQVLLVLLKKESYVWGDTWPLKWEYNSAMGYGCPDTAPCDMAYYGFYNQVHMAAYQFDRYKQKNYEYNYHPGMTNNIYYSPTYSCGTKQVYIENMATASLYIYTPYTPNDAALQNYPGTSYCGSYGNRNFFMYFNEWFGNVYAAQWSKMDFPRYMTAASDIKRIDPYTMHETNDTQIAKGDTIKYISKIDTKKGPCLRTEHNTINGIQACALISQLKEVELEFTDIPPSEQLMIISENSQKTSIRSQEISEQFDDSMIRVFKKKTVFLGKTFYITEYDSKNIDSILLAGFEEKYLTGLTGYEEISEYLRVVQDTSKMNIINKNTIAALKIGDVRKFRAKLVSSDGEIYYRTEYDHLMDNKENYISADSLSYPYAFEALEESAYYKLITDVDRINPVTGEYYDTLQKDRIILFSSRIFVNGQWYYRTAHNTENNLLFAVPKYALLPV